MFRSWVRKRTVRYPMGGSSLHHPSFSSYPAKLLVRPNPLIVQNQQAQSESEQITAHTEKSNEPKLRGEEAQKMVADTAPVLNEDHDDCHIDVEDDDCHIDVEDDDCNSDVEDDSWGMPDEEYPELKCTVVFLKDRLPEYEKEEKVFKENFKEICTRSACISETVMQIGVG